MWVVQTVEVKPDEDSDDVIESDPGGAVPARMVHQASLAALADRERGCPLQ
jgi:hypothetical protein